MLTHASLIIHQINTTVKNMSKKCCGCIARLFIKIDEHFRNKCEIIVQSFNIIHTYIHTLHSTQHTYIHTHTHTPYTHTRYTHDTQTHKTHTHTHTNDFVD